MRTPRFLLIYLIIPILLCQNMNAQDINKRPDPKIIPISTQQPTEQKIYPIGIIGAGAAGTMAINRSILNNQETLLFTGRPQERKKSCGNWVRKIENIPGLAKYERAILEMRNDTLKELAQSPTKHNLYVIEDSIFTIETQPSYFKLTDASGHTYFVQYVLLATGIMYEQPQIQGTIRPILKYANGRTVVYCPTCDGHRSYGKKTTVIGHSNSAASTALLLSQRYPLKNLTILTNGHKPEFSQEMLSQLQALQINIIENPITEIFGNAEQGQLSGFGFNTGHTIPSEIAFVSLGIRPNNQLALQLGAQVDSQGLVITNSICESSVPNLFVVGDLRANSPKQIYTAWQQAADTVLIINKRIREAGKK